MSAKQNKELLQHIFAELAKSNARPFVHAMADDFRWTVPGSNGWARTYDGKGAVITELFGALAEKIERVTTIAHRFIAEDDHVVVQARGANTTRGGAPYNNSYCFVFRIEDGKLKEVTEYMDTELATAVLGDPQPRAAE
jgi:ketosteroid isomerase-like protein